MFCYNESYVFWWTLWMQLKTWLVSVWYICGYWKVNNLNNQISAAMQTNVKLNQFMELFSVYNCCYFQIHLGNLVMNPTKKYKFKFNRYALWTKKQPSILYVEINSTTVQKKHWYTVLTYRGRGTYLTYLTSKILLKKKTYQQWSYI